MLFKINSEIYYVPDAFVATSDGASVPKLFAARFKTVKSDIAGYLHDFGCVYSGNYVMVRNKPEIRAISRAKNDRLFFDCLLSLGVPHNDAVAMYWAVRAYQSTIGNTPRQPTPKI